MRLAPPSLAPAALPVPDEHLRSSFAWRYYYSAESTFSRRAVRHVRHHRIEWAVHLLRGLAPLGSGALLLDVGCGPGESTAILQREVGPFRRIVGLDISDGFGPLYRALTAANGVAAEYVRGTCLALPVADASASLIVSFEMVEHVPEWQRFLRESARALEPGGVLLVSTPHATGLHAWLKRPYRWAKGFERLNRAFREDGDFYERFLPRDELAAGLREAGLEEAGIALGCHTLTRTPDRLLPLNVAYERALESRGWLPGASVTTFIAARRPAPRLPGP